MKHWIRRYSTKAEAEFAGRDNARAEAMEMTFGDALGNSYSKWVSAVKERKQIKTLRTNGDYE